MRVSFQIQLNQDEIHSKLYEAVKYLAGSASGLYHAYQLYYLAITAHNKAQDPVSSAQKKISQLVLCNQYLDCMQLYVVQGELKKSPDIFNNSYYKYVNVLFVFGGFFKDLELDIQPESTAYSYDDDYNLDVSESVLTFTRSVQDLFFKELSFPQAKDFLFAYQQIFIKLLKDLTHAYFPEEEFNALAKECIQTLEKDRFLRKVAEVIRSQAMVEAREAYMIKICDWTIKDASNYYFVMPIIGMLGDFIMEWMADKKAKDFVQSFYDYIFKMYEPDEMLFFRTGDGKVTVDLSKISCKEVFSRENILRALQIGNMLNFFPGVYDISEVPVTPENVHRFKVTARKKVVLSADYIDFAEDVGNQNATSQMAAKNRLLSGIADCINEYEYTHTRYSVFGIHLAAEKAQFSDYIKQSFQMQNTNIIPV